MSHRTIIRHIIAWGAVCLFLVGVIIWASSRRAGPASASGRDAAVRGDVPAGSAPVVVAELFTSEGCSTCPPADAVLGRLVQEPVAGVVVLGLGEHVDYWDRLGWRDRFSSPVFTRRQSVYQNEAFGLGITYTPELVIDGQFVVTASDFSEARRTIADAGRIPKAPIELTASPADAGHLSVHVRLRLPVGVETREQADVVVALTENHLTSDVRGGENSGRKLVHTAVVRSLSTLGSVQPPIRTFETTSTVPVATDWNAGNLRVVGFLQERRSRRIIGVGSARVHAHDTAPSAR